MPNKYNYLAIALILFIVAAITENLLLREHPESHLTVDIQKKLQEFEAKLEKENLEIKGIIADSSFDGTYFEALKDFTQPIDETGIGYLVYQSGSLVYWSDRSVAFFNSPRDYRIKDGLIQLPNGYYLVKTVKTDTDFVVGLHLIKYNYEHENRYLHNSFFKVYKIPESFEIATQPVEKSYAITSLNGDYIFSLKQKGDFSCREDQLYFPVFIYFLGLVFLLISFRYWFVETAAGLFFKLFVLAAALVIVSHLEKAEGGCRCLYYRLRRLHTVF